MQSTGERQKEALNPEFNHSIVIDFRGAKLTSDTGFLLLREIDERFGIIEGIKDGFKDNRSVSHSSHTIMQMVRQRVYQIAAGYEDCNDADNLRIDPALRLALGKGFELGASQSMLCRMECDGAYATYGNKRIGYQRFAICYKQVC